MKSWTSSYWPAFLIAVFVGFMVPELWSIWDGDPSTQPLTDWTVARGAGELAATLGLWVALHFGIREIWRRVRR